jgi:uncharacterized protein YjiS (DUF1127 family)
MRTDRLLNPAHREEIIMSNTILEVDEVVQRAPLRRLLTQAAISMTTLVLRRAGKRAMRDISALDDRTLADIGLLRSDLMLVCTLLTKAQAVEYLARPHALSFGSRREKHEEQ